MREIKFRAWTGKEMVEWRTLRKLHANTIFGTDMHTVMQFTGLVDKNNVEIYEGDIVRTLNPFNGVVAPNRVVEYNERTARYNGITMSASREMIIIGNIYENEGVIHAER